MKTGGGEEDLRGQTLCWLWEELGRLRSENYKLISSLSNNTFLEEKADRMVERIEERLGELSARVAFESRQGQ